MPVPTGRGLAHAVSSSVVALAILAVVLPVAAEIGDNRSGHGAKTYSPKTFPASGTDQCGNARHICDPDGIVSESTYAALAKQLKNLEAAPRFECGGAGLQGFQLGVALLTKLEDGPGSMQNFTEQIFNRWGIGHPSCQNGILFALSVNDRKNYIKTGKGASTVLTDNHAKDILESLRPRLRAGDYDAAVVLAVQRMVSEALEPGCPPVFYQLDNISLGFLHWAYQNPSAAFLLLLGVASCAVYMCNEFRLVQRKSQFKRKLQNLQSARQRLSKRGDCRDAPCPICLEVLPKDLSFKSEPTERGATLLRCGHVFHQTCIDQWLNRGSSVNCPVCRATSPRVDTSARVTTPHARPSLPDRQFWTFALDSLETAYIDLPGVERLRRMHSVQGSMLDSNADWVTSWEDAEREELQQAATQQRLAMSMAEKSNSDCDDSSWGGGNCDEGGGAGSDW